MNRSLCTDRARKSVRRIVSEKTFDLRRTLEETFLIGRRAGHDSAITYEFSARGACAEKRVSFRCHGGTYRSFDGMSENRLRFR
jgi:hypothetical protein